MKQGRVRGIGSPNPSPKTAFTSPSPGAAAKAGPALERLKVAARKGGNLFGELLEAAKYCTLGAISKALFEVGGAYRRNT